MNWPTACGGRKRENENGGFFVVCFMMELRPGMNYFNKYIIFKHAKCWPQTVSSSAVYNRDIYVRIPNSRVYEYPRF